MARVTLDQAQEQSASSNSDWFKLENDGDVAQVQFMCKNEDELDTFMAHRIKVNNFDRMVNCKREYGDPLDVCPFCASGLKTETAIILVFVDVKTKAIKVWQRGAGFIKKMRSLFNRYIPLDTTIFEIERNGEKGNLKTTYEFYPTNQAPLNLSEFEKPQILGRVIADWSVNEMEHYINTGEAPTKQDEDSSGTPRRRQSTSENSEQNMPRRRRNT